MELIVDATDMLVGRFGSYVAKQAILGAKVSVINCDKAVISGKRLKVIKEFLHKKDMGTWSHGPFYFRSSDRFVKRMIRGMLPHKQQKGRDALARIKCYNGVPETLKDKQAISYPQAHASRLQRITVVTIKEVCKHIGGTA